MVKGNQIKRWARPSRPRKQNRPKRGCGEGSVSTSHSSEQCGLLVSINAYMVFTCTMRINSRIISRCNSSTLRVAVLGSRPPTARGGHLVRLAPLSESIPCTMLYQIISSPVLSDLLHNQLLILSQTLPKWPCNHGLPLI
jgi:hypothetical protein